MGTHDFKLYNVPLFAKKPVNFNVSKSGAPKHVTSCSSKLS